MARIGVIIPDDMKEALDKIAAEEERNISYVVRKAIQEFLDGRQAVKVAED